MFKSSILLLVGYLLIPSYCSDNGLALTPPMGWMHWQRFRCLIDCELYPDECISENLFKQIADLLASDGYLAAGYEYLIIDDCWLAKERDENGKLQPDPDRFPSGIKALADYVHDLGLKFGIYEDYGTLTCGGYPGSLGHLETDANTFAEWGVDYLKLDGCYVETEGMEQGYGEMAYYLNQTGRPIVFSCSFPAYLGLDANYTAAVEYCNLWRNYADIQDSWESTRDIMDWFSTNQDFLIPYSGSGHWNDPDMLIIGNFGLSYEQSKAQMTVWAILAAPLIMSVDLRTIEEKYKEILLNPAVIQVNQDPLSIQGALVNKVNNIEIWIKPLSSEIDVGYAIGFVSRREDGFPYRLEISLEELGLTYSNGYDITDLFDGTSAILKPHESIVVRVKPLGAVLLRALPINTKSNLI